MEKDKTTGDEARDQTQQGVEPEDDARCDESADDAKQEQEPEGKSVTLSYAEYEELKTLAAERDDYLRRLQRSVADYQNLQKRVDKFRDAARESVLRSLGENILPVADSLSLALEAAEQTEGADNIVEGLELVEKSFYDALEKIGIMPIEAVGREFDPHYHDALMQEPAAGLPANRVVRELKKGFRLGDQVIRPSQVIVSGASPASQGEE